MVTHDQDRAPALLEDPDFRRLARVKNRVSLLLTAVMVVVYFGFIFLLAWRRDLFAARLGESLTAGIPIGIGVILASWLLTGVYVSWANTRYDAEVRRLRDKGAHGNG
jgi:uncharacterized membrane protein (DUF485 family)